jgi:putative tricarboxylic transport membrane protein
MAADVRHFGLLFRRLFGGDTLMTDRIITFCMIVLASVYLYATYKIPSSDSVDPLGPKAFPLLLGIGLAAAAVLLLAETMKAGGRTQEEKKEESSEESRKLFLQTGGVVTWTALFIMAFNPLGFVLATALYLFGLMAYLNPKKWWTNTITSVLFTVGIYALFSKGLGVVLAPGVIHF